MAEIQGHNNWVASILQNKSAKTLKIRQASCGQGKFYHYDDKSNEMEEYKVNEITISPGGEAIIAACGRDSSPTGTHGSFRVHDGDGPQICKVFWDVPYGAINKVKYEVGDQGDDWVVGPKYLDKDGPGGGGGPGAYMGRVQLRFAYIG